MNLLCFLALAALLRADNSDESFGAEAVTIYGHRESASAQLLESDDIDSIRSSGSLKEALEEAAGLDVQGLSGSKSFGKLSIRGADSKHTVVFLNGQRLGQDFDLGSVPTEDIERVEILKGPEALAYSPEALGGVLLIATRKADGGKKLWALGEGIGAFGTYQGQLSSPDLTIGPYSGSFSLNAFTSDGYVPNTDEQALELEQSSSLKFEEHQVDLKAGCLLRKGGIPLAKSLAANGAGEVDSDDREDRQAINLSLSDSTQFGSWGFKPDISGSYSSVRRLNPFDEDAQAGVSRDNTDNDTRFGLRLPFILRFDGGKLDLDLEAAQEDLLSGQAGFHTRNKASFSSRLKFKAWQRLSVELSGRADYADGFNVDLEPVGSLTYELYPGGRFSVSAGGGRKLPELDQLYRSYQPFGPLAPPEFGAGEKGNPGLQPERSIKTQAALDFQEKHFSLKLAGYADFLSDLINLQEDETDDFWTYANLDQARVYGGEASLSAKLGPFKPFANYTYVDSRELDGDLIPGRLHQKLSYGASLETLDIIELRADHQYFERNDAENPYWMLNASLTAKISPHIKIFGNVCNVLDQLAEVLPGLPLRGRYIEAGSRIEF